MDITTMVDMNQVNHYWNWIQTNILNNQFLIGMIGGGLVYWSKNIWNSITKFFSRYFVVSATFANDRNPAYRAIEMWINDTVFIRSKWQKNVEVRTNVKDDWADESTAIKDIVIVPATGKHLFLYKKRLFWITKHQVQNQQSGDRGTTIKYYYTISTTAITNTYMKSFIHMVINYCKEQEAKEREDNKLCVRTYDGDWWSERSKRVFRDFDSIYIDEDTKKQIIDKIDFFVNNKQWYRDRHIPYKLGILLYGIPGVGKSSIIQALAEYIQSDIFYITSLLTSEDKFISMISQAVYQAKENSTKVSYSKRIIKNTVSDQVNSINQTSYPLLTLEDADSYDTLKSRGNIVDSRNIQSIENNENNDDPSQSMSLKLGVGLTTILNIFDGVMTPDGLIFVITTNAIDKLDPALFRPGRIDLCIEIKPINYELIKKMCYDFDSSLEIDIPKDTTIVPAKLQELLMMQYDSKTLSTEILKYRYKE